MRGGKRISRRGFLGRAVKAAAGGLVFPYVVSSSAVGNFGAVPPSERINVGLIGSGGQGARWWGHLPVLLEMPDVRFLAVCDVRKELRENVKRQVDEKYGGSYCAVYNDFMNVVDRRDLDAVFIATPDHWHGIMTVEAAKTGRNIYCEKPLTRTFAEGVAVRKYVNKYGVVFQHGTQQRSDARMVFGCELVRNGRIGKLKKVKMGIPPGARIGPQKKEVVPDGFDYDMWLGSAPWAEYCEKRVVGDISHSWYFISDYCIGHLSGWGIHHIDSAQQGGGTDYTGPVEIEGKGVFPTEGLYDTAVTWDIRYRFANGVEWECTDTSKNRMGILFEGEKGWVFIWRGIVDAEPKSLLREVIGPGEIRLYRSVDHRRNFIDCIKRANRETAAPVEVGHRSNTICILGDIAMRLGRKLQWDAEKEEFVGDDEANRMLSRSMRSPWCI